MTHLGSLTWPDITSFDQSRLDRPVWARRPDQTWYYPFWSDSTKSIPNSTRPDPIRPVNTRPDRSIHLSVCLSFQRTDVKSPSPKYPHKGNRFLKSNTWHRSDFWTSAAPRIRLKELWSFFYSNTPERVDDVNVLWRLIQHGIAIYSFWLYILHFVCMYGYTVSICLYMYGICFYDKHVCWWYYIMYLCKYKVYNYRWYKLF